MRSFLPLLFLCLLGTCGRAQIADTYGNRMITYPGDTTAGLRDSLHLEYATPRPTRRIFPISAALADRWRENGRKPASLGPALPAGTLADTLPPGHYVEVVTRPERVSYSTFDTYAYELRSRGLRGGKLHLQLFDATGRERTDAVILASDNDRRVRYRKRQQGYVIRDWDPYKLKVYVGSDTLYYDVKPQYYRSRLRHDWDYLRETRAAKVLQVPYEIVRAPVRYVIRGIRRPRTLKYYPGRNTLKRLFHPHRLVGYVATDQPQYRHGDTVRVTAYLSRRKGRPARRDSLRMHVRAGNKQLTRSIGRGAPGRYTTSFVIGEDWPLDKSATIYFYTDTKRRVEPSAYFQIADYELPEYELEVEASRVAKTAAQTYVDIRAKDANGQPLPNGRLRTTILLDRFNDGRDSTLITLPDTLYDHFTGTDNRIEHRQFLPDSLFPLGYSVSLNIHVQLTGPSGEYAEGDRSMTVDRRFPHLLQLEVRGDSLHGFLLPVNDRLPVPRASATLVTELTVRADLTETVELPFVRRLDHRVSGYELRVEDQMASKNMRELDPGLDRSAEAVTFRSDTLVLHLPNAHRQPLYWKVWDGGKVLANGASPTAQITDLPTGNQLYLELRYLAGGEWRRTWKPFRIPGRNLLTDHPKELQLTVDQPERVLPGQTVRVEVTARDQRGRPARNVRLTAGSYNARFEDLPVRAPGYLRGRERVSNQRQDYTVTKERDNWSRPLPEWLVTEFQLDTSRAYALHAPRPEYRHVRSLEALLPTSEKRAHLALFVIREGRRETIRSIHANNRLAYWYHASSTTPYTVPVDTGLVQLRVRTNTHVYTKWMSFRPRTQTILSFAAEHATAAGWTERPIEEPEESEVRAIYNQVFALQDMAWGQPVFLRARAGAMIQSAGNAGNKLRVLGLVDAERNVTVQMGNRDTLNLRFERHARYRIGAGRDRLYPLAYEQILEYERGKAVWQAPPPGLPRYAFPTLVRSVQPRATNVRHLPRLRPLDRRARFQTACFPPSVDHVILIPTDSLAVFGADAGAMKFVRPGEYDVVFDLRGDSLRYQRVTFTADHLTRIDFREAKVMHRSEYRLPLGRGNEEEIIEIRQDVGEDDRRKPSSDQNFRGNNYLTGRVIDQETGEALPFATVMIQEWAYGTHTDFDGNFYLKLPYGDFTLHFTYTGYSDVITHYFPTVLNTDLGDIQMDPAAGVDLSSITITAYKIPIVDQDRTTTGDVLTDAAIRNLPTRDVNSIASVVAGVSAYDEGRAINIRGSRVNAVGYYVDGIHVSAPGETERGPAKGPLPPPTIRGNFRDHAAFVPELVTDRDGKVAFNITFPDDITAWNTYAVGQDRRRRVGFNVVQTNAFLPVQAQLYLPRFLVAGDRSEARGLAINREGQSLRVRLAFGGEAVPVTTRDTLLEEAVERAYPITAPEEGTSTDYRFTLQTLDEPTVSDGEERTVPLYPIGAEMVSGELILLDEETEGLMTDFVRPERGDVTLRFYGNRLERLLNDLDHVINYPYACTEQTASRLIGLLSLKRIRTAEGRPFGREREVKKMIARLMQLRRTDGGYGWWPNSPNASPWITLHVYRALNMADDEGYAIGSRSALERYLLSIAPSLDGSPKTPSRRPNFRLQILLAIAEAGNPPTDAEMLSLDTLPTPSHYELLGTARLHQLRGDTVNVERLLDSATQMAAGGMYWGEDVFRRYRQPLGNRLASTLLAHRVLRSAGRTGEADRAVAYLLGNRTGGPRAGQQPLLGTNTLESAHLLTELLPELMVDGKVSVPRVRLSSPTLDTTVAAFPQQHVVPAAEISAVKLARSGSGPLAVSVYQRWFERNPTPASAGFTVTSRFTDARHRALDYLTLGETAYLEVTVTVAEEADYVLVEIPIPAGCSYADREEARGPRAVHREYRRDRVAIFCDRLPAGEYVYRVALAPRFGGRYTVNPVGVEMQYLPVVRGMGAAREVEVR